MSLRSIAAEIAAKGCQIIHGDYPPGTTCLDKIEHARENPSRYTTDYRERILRGEGVCDRCRLKQAIATAANAPPALHVAVYPCGAFDARRTVESAESAGNRRANERSCCDPGHGSFEVWRFEPTGERPVTFRTDAANPIRLV